jgi:hypothetical protein
MDEIKEVKKETTIKRTTRKKTKRVVDGVESVVKKKTISSKEKNKDDIVEHFIGGENKGDVEKRRRWIMGFRS